jgi:uncharacterized protein YecE (DUF72 family)
MLGELLAHLRSLMPWKSVLDLNPRCEAIDYRYAEEELDEWVPKVEEAAGKVKKIYGYFNNHFHGYAPENCLYMLRKLGLITEQQEAAEERTRAKQANLSDFFKN